MTPTDAPSASASTSCPASLAGASSGTSTTQADLVALLTRRAADDPAWWGVVRVYADGHRRYPHPFQPRRP